MTGLKQTVVAGGVLYGIMAVLHVAIPSSQESPVPVRTVETTRTTAARAQQEPPHHSEWLDNDFSLEKVLEMDDPRAAATKLRNAVRGRRGMEKSLRGHMDYSSPTYRVFINGEEIPLQGIDEGLAAVLKEHESSKRNSDRVTCILRLAQPDTYRDYFEQIAHVLSRGVRLYPSGNSDWVFFCTPTLAQFKALERLSFVAGLREFRPEYKYTKERRPGAVFPDLLVRPILSLGESQLQDLREMGFTIKSHARDYCTVLGGESDLPRIAELWWVKAVYRHYSLTPDVESDGRESYKAAGNG